MLAGANSSKNVSTRKAAVPIFSKSKSTKDLSKPAKIASGSTEIAVPSVEVKSTPSPQTDHVPVDEDKVPREEEDGTIYALPEDEEVETPGATETTKPPSPASSTPKMEASTSHKEPPQTTSVVLAVAENEGKKPLVLVSLGV